MNYPKSVVVSPATNIDVFTIVSDEKFVSSEYQDYEQMINRKLAKSKKRLNETDEDILSLMLVDMR
jgi:excinuclease ABC subunit C